jgi:hypothetical protein
VIGDATVESGAPNPANGCEVCDPIASTTDWSPAVDETPCADDFGRVCCASICCPQGQCCTAGKCGPCRCTIGDQEFLDGDFNPANDCEVCRPALDAGGWSRVTDNAPCGNDPDRVCCQGACCADGSCCHSLDSPEATCGPEPCHCTIGEDEIAEGDLNPMNPCERCDPTVDPTDWTPLPDNSPCGENGDRVCCLGTCCESGECCTLNVCGLCGCLIEGQGVADGAFKPGNECLVCDPVQDPFNWSPVADDSSCGAAGNQVCCAGVCCGLRRCCRPDGVCDIEFCGLIDPCEHLDACGCTIDGVFVPNLTLKPGNPCERCNVSQSTTDWSPNGFAGCGLTGQQFCNGSGVCCPLGICPDLNQPGGCGDFCDAVCVIGGVLFHQGDHNPSEACQVCSPLFSQTSWTTICSTDCCAALPCGHCP